MSRTLDAEIQLCDVVAAPTLADEALIVVGGIVSRTLLSSLAVAVATSFVTQTITNGVTDKAPSEDAVFDALALKAPLASPTFTGTPLAPTAAPGTNTTQLATTAFVTVAVAALSTVYQPLDADLTAWALVNPSSYSTTAQADALYQPLDSDLTSWAAITRASGFDTFAATPTSANLVSLVTDETGSGALVFATSPTLSGTIGGTLTFSGNLTLSSASVPLTVNSTNSNQLKQAFWDNSSVRGYLGADATYCFVAGDSSGNVRMQLTQAGVLAVGGSPVDSRATKPAFHAYITSDQTGIAGVTFTKVNFDAEAFDIGGYYDTTNKRWTPPAGKVCIYAQFLTSGALTAGSSGGGVIVSLYKNGGEIRRGTPFYTIYTGEAINSVMSIEDANGSDYFEIFVYAILSSGTATISNSSATARFVGYVL